MAHIGTTGFRDGIKVDINDAIEVVCHNLGHIMQLVKVILPIRDKGWQSKRSKITDSRLLWGRIFNDLGAKVGRLDGAKIFLVGFRFHL